MGVFNPLHAGGVGTTAVDTRRAPTWEMVEGVKTEKARLVATGLQDPDLKDGVVDASGCVRLRSSHLQVLSLSTLAKWKLWSLDVKNALCRRMASPGMFASTPPQNGIPPSHAVFGNCALQRMAYAMPQLPSIDLCRITS